jgi:hypothetical protein
MVDGLPGREVVGQQTPGAAAFDDVEDSVEDLTEAVEAGSAVRLGSGQVGLQVRPLLIRDIGGVGFPSHMY